LFGVWARQDLKLSNIARRLQRSWRRQPKAPGAAKTLGYPFKKLLIISHSFVGIVLFHFTRSRTESATFSRVPVSARLTIRSKNLQLELPLGGEG
jgi:hypothetical protein